MRIPGTAIVLPGTGASSELTHTGARHLSVIEGGGQGGLGDPARLFAADKPHAASGIDGDSPYWDVRAGGIDLNPELTGHTKYLVYEEMRKADPAIKSLLWMYKLPLRGADWGLDRLPGEEDIDKIIYQACAEQFGLEGEDGWLDLSWDEWLQQSTLCFDFGSMFEEIIDAQEPILWRPQGAAPEQSRIIQPIARFAPRFPGTIEEIETDTRTGRIKRARQMVAGADWMPGEQIAHYVIEKEGSNWYGTSMLRSCYGPWRLKKALMIGAAIGWDRYSSGVPVVRYPKQGGTRDKAEAQTIARNYRTHERAWVVFEGEAKDGWSIDIVSGAGSMADPLPLLRFYDEQIATGGLQQFSKLGTTATGSRAVGEVLVDPFYQAVTAYGEYIRTQRQKLALRYFVTKNFGEEFRTPNLRVGKIQQRNVFLLAQAVEMLGAAGLSFTDRDTQNDLRDILDLRHLPDEAAAAIDALPDEVGLDLPRPEGAGLPALPA